MQRLLIKLSNDLWSSNSPVRVTVPSRGCCAPEWTNGPSRNQVGATGSEREEEVIFRMSYQQEPVTNQDQSLGGDCHFPQTSGPCAALGGSLSVPAW